MSEQKETINIQEFVKEGIKALGYNVQDPITETRTRFVCPKCNKKYNDSTKFCSEDGSEIIEESYEINNGYADDDITTVIYDLENIPDDSNFGYVYIDIVEKRGDGEGYHAHHIFKRKSDDKLFYYYMYDGRVEETNLEETKKVVTTTWDFERYFD